jgi:ATP-dependent exoDNAse (exonuclease V) alpha subunit
MELSEEQQKAVTLALTNGVSIITGGPGTGKTTIIRCIIDLMQEQGYAAALAAPTGRAAKRMTEATGNEAKTIHRLLEFIPGEGFQRNRDNPLVADMVIVDEMSMVDAPLMYALLQALTKGTRLVLVGDRDQLPPVGCGNVFADLLDSEVMPYYRLTEIFRQAQRSNIVRSAHLINNGRMPLLVDHDSDFIFEEIPGVDPLKYQKTAPADAASADELATVKLRFKAPDGDKSELISTPVAATPKAFEQTSTDFRFAAAVAAFGQILRESEFKGSATFESVLQWAQAAKGKDEDGLRQEFIGLVQQASKIKK